MNDADLDLIASLGGPQPQDDVFARRFGPTAQHAFWAEAEGSLPGRMERSDFAVRLLIVVGFLIAAGLIGAITGHP